MTHRWAIYLSLALAAVFIFLPPPHPTLAQDDTCKTCHEHRYYMYDSGKWFCLCEAPMHCVYCHDGNPESLVKETAHAGMVRFPARSQAERCQTCHGADYLVRLAAFEQNAGLRAEPPSASFAPILPAETISDAAAVESPLRLLERWQLFGLVVVGFALSGNLIFGYTCWKSDCRKKNQQ
jgi:hypothetical protein